MSKRKPGSAEGEQTQEQEQKAEIVPYRPARPLPQKLVDAITEYSRLLGASAYADNYEQANGVFITFPDQSQVHVTGGEYGNAIAVYFLTHLPKLVFQDKAIRILKKRIHKISMLWKLGYENLGKGLGDEYGDSISMVKDKETKTGKPIDTSDGEFVMAELERVTKILGHQNSRRGVKKRKNSR